MTKDNDSEGFLPQPMVGESRLPGKRPVPPRTQIAEMAASMPSVGESSYTESVIKELVTAILDEGQGSLERAEAVLALKSYLQAEWDDVGAHVGVTGRSLQIIAGIVKLRPPFRESLRSRALGLRHGAALVRLAEQEESANQLHAYMLKNPDVGGEEALRLAGLMVRDPALTPERARRQLGEDVRRRLVLRGMTDTGDQAGPPATIAGLRSAVDAVSALNVSQLDGPTRRALSSELAEAAKVISRLEKTLK